MSEKTRLALRRLGRRRQMQTGAPLVISGSRLSLRWYESWVVRAFALSALVLFCGYLSSLFIAVQGIDSVARIAYDEDIEEGLNNNLKMIKEAHQLRKENFIARLKEAMPRAVAGNPAAVSEARLRAWLADASIPGFVNVEDAKIKNFTATELTEFKKTNVADIAWLDQETLRVDTFKISFPKSLSFSDFQSAQSLLQRYQFIGATLDKEIIPTLIRANSIVLALTFILLVSALLIVARRFKHGVERVIEGFTYWSETNPLFRFSNKWRGELRLITAQFNAMADDVEANRKKNLYLEKIASWQTIARKLAHEIKNPLTPIQMMVSQLSRRYGGENADYKKLLDNAQAIITEEVDGLRRMVDNFSEFARLPLPKPVNSELVGLLGRVCDLQTAAYPQHRIALQTNLKAASAKLDEDLIRQVLINLIKNAAEACGEKPAEILLRLDEAPDYYKIVVEDNGPGIPGELQGEIFEAYFTTKHSGPNPGMGLGLAICQKIILDHEGELSVKSQPGKTEFVIKLPKILTKGFSDVV